MNAIGLDHSKTIFLLPLNSEPTNVYTHKILDLDKRLKKELHVTFLAMLRKVNFWVIPKKSHLIIIFCRIAELLLISRQFRLHGGRRMALPLFLRISVFSLLNNLGGYLPPEAEVPIDLTPLIVSLLRINGAPLFDLYLDFDQKNSSLLLPVVGLPLRFGFNTRFWWYLRRKVSFQELFHFLADFIHRDILIPPKLDVSDALPLTPFFSFFMGNYFPFQEFMMNYGQGYFRGQRARRDSDGANKPKMNKAYAYMKATIEEKRLLVMEKLMQEFMDDNLSAEVKAKETHNTLLFVTMLTKVCRSPSPEPQSRVMNIKVIIKDCRLRPIENSNRAGSDPYFLIYVHVMLFSPTVIPEGKGDHKQEPVQARPPRNKRDRSPDKVPVRSVEVPARANAEHSDVRQRDRLNTHTKLPRQFKQSSSAFHKSVSIYMYIYVYIYITSIITNITKLINRESEMKSSILYTYVLHCDVLF